MYSLKVPKENDSSKNLLLEKEIERLIETYGKDVLRTSYLYLKNKDLSEDAFQEVFLKIYRKYETFENRSHEKTWIIRITINVCKDILRSSWLKRILPFEKISDTKSTAGFEDKIIKNDENRLLFDAVLSLPTIYKDVVILYYYQEFDTPQISKVLNIAEGTVRSRLHRAREILRSKIGGRIEYNE